MFDASSKNGWSATTDRKIARKRSSKSFLNSDQINIDPYINLKLG